MIRATNRRTIDEWLVEGLITTYQVPLSVVYGWVVREEVLPLLDGRDEIETT